MGGLDPAHLPQPLLGEARLLREKFRAWFAAVENVAVTQAQRIFDQEILCFDERSSGSRQRSSRPQERRAGV